MQQWYTDTGGWLSLALMLTLAAACLLVDHPRHHKQGGRKL